MIAAMTPGTAYGAKNARRKNRLPRSSGEVEQQGEDEREPEHHRDLHDANSSTRRTEPPNSVAWNTSTYWSQAAEHLRRGAELALALDLLERLPHGVQDRCR